MSFLDKIRVYMSLHDVSKHDDQRLDPKANASDTRAQRDATNTTSIHPVTDATTTRGYLQTGSGRILGNDGSNNVGLFGFDSTGAMVVKVAKSGFDADTASNANLVFNSAQNVFKIVQTGTAQMTVSSIAAGATQTVTTAHNLGVIPGFLSFIQMPANAPNNNVPTGYLCMPQLWAISNAAAMWFSARVDATNIYFDVTNTATGTSTGPWVFNYKFYILQETAN